MRLNCVAKRFAAFLSFCVMKISIKLGFARERATGRRANRAAERALRGHRKRVCMDPWKSPAGTFNFCPFRHSAASVRSRIPEDATRQRRNTLKCAPRVCVAILGRLASTSRRLSNSSLEASTLNCVFLGRKLYQST